MFALRTTVGLPLHKSAILWRKPSPCSLSGQQGVCPFISQLCYTGNTVSVRSQDNSGSAFISQLCSGGNTASVRSQDNSGSAFISQLCSGGNTASVRSQDNRGSAFISQLYYGGNTIHVRFQDNSGSLPSQCRLLRAVGLSESSNGES